MPAATNIVIVGGGPMGSAIARGLKRSSPDMSITVVEPDPRRRAELIEASIPTLENQPPPPIHQTS
ncbi:NAD-binding protein [Pseudomonas veronii]|uniref:RCK N-terminal domain-containing protein n=1 Tax=Pseudomonas veronii TaxID=76761 RepID=A0A5M8ESV3_PSEVE|nr:hypothetical protein F3K53_19635 [Pseudomonas veronii]KAA6180381.1 hypothetical protein F3K54_06815 [Pseudomonas veronii]